MDRERRCRARDSQGQGAHRRGAGVPLEQFPERRYGTERAGETCGKGLIAMSRPSLTIGIEEEYQTIDPESRDLRSHIASEILSKGKLALSEAIKPEMPQSVIEVGTRVCKNIQEARENILELRREVITLAGEQ